MIAIFAAMESEVRACLPALVGAQEQADGRFPVVSAEGVLICQTGLGRRALEAANSLLREFEPEAVLSVGTAGGLAPGLGVGEIVFCESISHALEPGSVVGHRGLIEAAMITATQAGVSGRRGSSVTVDTVAWGPEEKSALRANGQADITEMESFWIGKAAARRNLPYLAIRVVSDDANHQLAEIPGLFDERGRVDAHRVLAYTREHPEVIPELAAQHARGGIALDSLERFLVIFVPSVRQAL